MERPVTCSQSVMPIKRIQGDAIANRDPMSGSLKKIEKFETQPTIIEIPNKYPCKKLCWMLFETPIKAHTGVSIKATKPPPMWRLGI